MQALSKCVLFTIIIPSFSTIPSEGGQNHQFFPSFSKDFLNFISGVNKRLQQSEIVESNGYLPKVPWFKYEVLYFLHLDTVFLVNMAARG